MIIPLSLSLILSLTSIFDTQVNGQKSNNWIMIGEIVITVPN